MIINVVECGCGYKDEAIAHQVIVDQNGGGDYRTLQDTIKSVPSNNTQIVNIVIRPGIYRSIFYDNSFYIFYFLLFFFFICSLSFFDLSHCCLLLYTVLSLSPLISSRARESERMPSKRKESRRVCPGANDVRSTPIYQF
ncbi:hypothetical protein AMTRI_Chr03g49950 [Amborella trichopoda]